ncbi:phosphoethanolamine transferase [Hippea sp. KM1]|uniref:phosphoethanolamine transferase n=1 Tax=Hippea sp. KM1 TaxID=944481 RepID=UPI0004B1454A|nr:phosphoethanolamine--lipid A transferase [Hippea sp. KM1]
MTQIIKRIKNIQLSQTQIILLASAFFVIFDNKVFFSHSYQIYKTRPLFLACLGIFLFVVIALSLAIILNRYILKPFLSFLFIASAAAYYYMDEYGTIINSKMIENIFETDTKEVYDLLNIKLFLIILLVGIVPSVLLWMIKIKKKPIKEELKDRLKLIALCIASLPLLYIAFPKAWVSFFRTHKRLRMYSNPTFYMYSLGEYIGKTYLIKPMKFKHVGLDAKLIPQEGKPKLLIFVVGEAARYDHFSLNGYKRNTNPQLSKIKNLISYPDMHSCGTETAVSVPCMFSFYSRKHFSVRKARHTDSLLDILSRVKVNVLWRENNSSSKGVASRIKNYVDLKNANIKPYCNRFECHDEILLYKLQDWLNNIHNNRPVFIVLHQMGSHGPAYYKRYPKSFERFKPVCKTNQLQKCSRQSIINAYDNTILYTDKFLSEVIDFLKKNQSRYRVAMIYVADHGESLGENGIYLHGLPYFIAPDVQKHPAAIAWFGKHFGIDINCAKKLSKKPYSHDNIFSTVLGLLDVKTKLYNPKLDMYRACRKQTNQQAN